MGMNYYAEGTVECKNCGEEHLCKNGVHLGKSSAGWRFLFAFNGGEYYKDVSSMKQWLKNRLIYDECGERVSHKDFWEMVARKQEIGREPHNDGLYEMDIDGYRFMDGEFC